MTSPRRGQQLDNCFRVGPARPRMPSPEFRERHIEEVEAALDPADERCSAHVGLWPIAAEPT